MAVEQRQAIVLVTLLSTLTNMALSTEALMRLLTSASVPDPP